MFFSAPRAGTSDRSVFGDYWFTPIGTTTGSGARVAGDGALALTAVWACVRNISEDFAKLPFCLYRPLTGGGKVEVTDHWLYRLFAKAPNKWQTPFEWREMLEGHLLLRGNAYSQIVPDGIGGIAQLVPMHPDRVKMELLASGNFRYRFTGLDGSETILRRDQVWHLRGLSPDGYMGYSPIQVQRQALGVGMSRQEYAERFFANDAKPTGGWIEMAGKFADKAAREAFKTSWTAVQGGPNRGKVAVLDQGMKYHEVGFNNRDSQFVEASQMSVTEVARMFRSPPHKIGDLSRATFGNIEQQNIEYATDCIQSWCERWESSIESALLGEDTDLEVEFDISSLMRGDMAARSSYINMGVINGTLTRNEAREMEGRNPIEGLDDPLVPMNMAIVDEDGEIEPPAAPAPPTKPSAPNETPADDAEARLRAVLTINAARMARRISAGPAPHSDVLAAAMAITQESAAKWLEESPKSLNEAEIAASLLGLAMKVSV